VPLASGRKLGPYEIHAPLGAGGMGEVYRARDERLEREVALKVLPQAVASDPERMARFQREAQVLASLNHPNIASIYGLEESGGVRALVMELVEGPTLAERIKQGALPIDETLQITKQIAEALEAAHEKGIIHRDLKPANVKVTPDGKVKVLDFGLAKAFAPDSGVYDISHSPTLTAEATREGLILGTAAYMSPEQARGKALDKRTDIWAFGCVLFECLTGRQAFGGDTVSDTVASILTRAPDFETLPAATPSRTRELLRRCLEKDVNHRLHDIADARLEIEETITQPSGPVAAIAASTLTTTRWGRLLPWALVLVLGVGLAVLGWRQFHQLRSETQPVVRLTANLPPKVSFGDASWPLLAFVPDGTGLVFAGAEEGVRQLYLRQIDQWDAVPIRGTEGASRPFLSPDGQWVAFTAARKLKKVAIGGGPAVELCEAEWGGGSWSPDDEIVYTKDYNSGLWKIPAAGGSPQMLTSPDRSKGELGHWWPQILPGRETVLFTAFSTPRERSRIVVRSLKTGEQRTLIEGAVFARYASSGHLIYAQGETVLAVPFDLRRLEVTGAAVPVLEGVAFEGQNGDSQYTVSDNGVLAFLRGSSILTAQNLVSIDRSGRTQSIRENIHAYGGIRLSPDGRRIALGRRESGAPPDVWIQDLERGSLTRLTFGPASNFDPIWTTDGKRILYVSERPVFDIYWKAADGSGSEEALLSTGMDKYPVSVSPDGKTLLMSVSDPKTDNDLWLLPLEGKREPQPFLTTRFKESTGAFSPDGRLIAYESTESGRAEVYVQAYPAGGSRWQVSTDGGSEPLWTRNGKELVYRAGKKLMAVPMSPDPGSAPGKPAVLFEGDFSSGERSPGYDVAPDGQRFYFIQQSKQADAQVKLDIVLNWFEELKHRVPAGKK
jgi:eukaryotic-like serine/threonine-protein kinase